MSGHGWVTPNADGSRARCGGPAMCKECALEYTREHYKAPKQLTASHQFVRYIVVHIDGWALPNCYFETQIAANEFVMRACQNPVSDWRLVELVGRVDLPVAETA